jgi:hypothetical protein
MSKKQPSARRWTEVAGRAGRAARGDQIKRGREGAAIGANSMRQAMCSGLRALILRKNATG